MLILDAPTVLSDEHITLNLGLDPRSTETQQAWHIARINGKLTTEKKTKVNIDLTGYGFGRVQLLKSKVSQQQSLEARLKMSHRSARFSVGIAGDVNAQGCGVVFHNKHPELPKGTATVRVANTTYAIKSAAVYHLSEKGDRYLVLSTAPQSCNDIFSMADLRVSLVVPFGAEKISDVGFSGAAFKEDLIEHLEPDSPRKFPTRPQLEGSGVGHVSLPAMRVKVGSLPAQIQGDTALLRCGLIE